jgi:hypothetical protein
LPEKDELGSQNSVAAHSENGSEPPLLLTASAAFSSARQEARTDLDLASQKIYKSSGPFQMPSAPPLVGSSNGLFLAGASRQQKKKKNRFHGDLPFPMLTLTSMALH